MPIRQPVSKTIHLNDFRDHTFSFPVESVLKPQQGSGKLIISTSPGYLLTTSPDHEPTPEQTLEHVLQPDGNRIARGTITLLANDGPLADSTVTIRNPSGETVILTVDSTPETALITQAPALQVSASALTFAKTTPGKPLFMVFAVAQQNTNVPVTITSDEPTLFQVASDSRPAFSSSLTFVPSATGTYVHVRYFPNRAGRAEAHLIIETPYASQFVALTGRCGGLLPVIGNAQVSRRLGTAAPARPVSASRRPWLTAVLVSVLALAVTTAGYQFRCRLLPDLCRETEQSSTAARTSAPVAAAPKADRMAVTKKTPLLKPEKALKAKKEPQPVADAVSPEITPVAPPVVQKPLAEPTPEPLTPPVAGPVRSQPLRRTPARPTTDLPDAELRQPPVSPVLTPTGESELERELNQKPTNQKTTVPKSVTNSQLNN